MLVGISLGDFLYTYNNNQRPRKSLAEAAWHLLSMSSFALLALVDGPSQLTA